MSFTSCNKHKDCSILVLVTITLIGLTKLCLNASNLNHKNKLLSNIRCHKNYSNYTFQILHLKHLDYSIQKFNDKKQMD
jgi:hypothetical protein